MVINGKLEINKPKHLEGLAMRVLFKYKCGILFSGNGFMEKMNLFFDLSLKNFQGPNHQANRYLAFRLPYREYNDEDAPTLPEDSYYKIRFCQEYP